MMNAHMIEPRRFDRDRLSGIFVSGRFHARREMASSARQNGFVGRSSIHPVPRRNRGLTVRTHPRRDHLVVNCEQEPSLISTQRRLFRVPGAVPSRLMGVVTSATERARQRAPPEYRQPTAGGRQAFRSAPRSARIAFSSPPAGRRAGLGRLAVGRRPVAELPQAPSPSREARPKPARWSLMRWEPRRAGDRLASAEGPHGHPAAAD